MVILIAPAVTTSCVEQAEKDVTEQATIVKPEVNNKVACKLTENWTGQRVNHAGIFVLTQNDTGLNLDEAPEPGEIVPEEDTGTPDYFSWKNILIAVLGIASAILGTKWKRATNTITAIGDALKDGKVDKAELDGIIKTWKGN